MKYQHLFIGLFFLGVVSCNGQSIKKKSVFEIKDKFGRVIELYGNYQELDRNTNFRYFLYYDSTNRVVKEKRFFFDDNNIECIISDSLAYREILYKYNKNGVLSLEQIFNPKYNFEGKAIAHYLAYQKNYETGLEESFEEPKSQKNR